MYRKKYKFNPETLRFEKIQKPLKWYFREGLIYFGVLSVFFVGLRISVDEHLSSPKVKFFTEQNIELKRSYSLLNQKISLAEDYLSELQRRDDRVYRSVFDLAPIPSSVREAGFGGSENYYPQLFARDVDFVRKTAQKLDKLSNKVKVQTLSLNDLYQKALEQQMLLARKPSISPISPSEKIWLTSAFGYRPDPFTKIKRMHHGIDLAGNVGINIYATGDGVVEVSRINRFGYGKEVVINHGFGFQSVYAHLDKIHVKEGQLVKRGQLLGELGNSGRSTGPHLHYEIREYDRPVNPFLFYFEDLTPDEYKEIASVNSY